MKIYECLRKFFHFWTNVSHPVASFSALLSCRQLNHFHISINVQDLSSAVEKVGSSLEGVYFPSNPVQSSKILCQVCIRTAVLNLWTPGLWLWWQSAVSLHSQWNVHLKSVDSLKPYWSASSLINSVHKYILAVCVCVCIHCSEKNIYLRV